MSHAEPLLVRLLLRTHEGAMHNRLGRCWMFDGPVNEDGYGVIGTGVGKATALAHRALYELLVGPIPDGYELDHLCVTPGCVRPSHLEPVTHAENLRRIAGRRNGLCGKGLHRLEGSNLMTSKTTSRCRACRTAWRQANKKDRKVPSAC